MGISLGCVALMAGGIGLLSGWFGELPANAGDAEGQADLPGVQAALRSGKSAGHGAEGVFAQDGTGGTIVAEAAPKAH